MIEHAVHRVLNELQPYIQQHGGAIEFVSYDAGVVTVRLQGACVGCPMSYYTLKLGIEERIKERVPEVKKVVALE
jgi:Fe-S cluster biogenesis protein NfuA